MDMWCCYKHVQCSVSQSQTSADGCKVYETIQTFAEAWHSVSVRVGLKGLAVLFHVVRQEIAMEDPSVDVTKEGRRKIRRLFYWHSIGIVLGLSSIVCLQTLQTSINIEGNKGAISLTAGYVSSILFSIFCCPSFVRVFGLNVTLVIADASFLAYSLSNFFPNLAVLTIGAVISGIGRSIYFPAYTMIVLNLASGYVQLTDVKSEAHYRDFFQSRFYGMLESISIIGNCISYAVLYTAKSTKNQGSGNDFTSTTASTDFNATGISTGDPYEFCGVEDCQDPDVVNDSIDQYVPPDAVSVYILITLACCLCISSILVHSLIYPGLGKFSHKLSNILDKVLSRPIQFENVSKTSQSSDLNQQEGLNCNNNKAYIQGDEEPQIPEKELQVKDGHDDGDTCDIVSDKQDLQIAQNFDGRNSHSTSLEYPTTERRESDTSTADTKIAGEVSNGGVISILKATAIFMVQPRPVMLNVSTLHYGMILGFIFADLTRAYASCVAGVEKTGLFAVVFGLTAMPSALLYGRISFHWKRYILYAASCLSAFGLYIACYFWIPDPDNLWALFLIFAGFGTVHSFLRQNLVAAYTLHFPENKNIAFSVFNVFFMGGVGLQYGLSISMCVVEKIYIQVGVLAAGAILFVIAEVLRHRKLKKEADTGLKSEEMSTEL